MPAMLTGFIALVCFLGAFLIVRRLQRFLPEDHLSDESSASVRVGIAVVSTLSGLVLGLVLSSMKMNFDNVQRDVRRFGTELIMVDTALRSCDAIGVVSRQQLLEYARAALSGTWPADGSGVVVDDRAAAMLLQRTDRSIVQLATTDPSTVYYADRARNSMDKLINLRATIISENKAFLQPAFIIVVILWFTLLFGGFGYRAPNNYTVTTSMLCAAIAIASAITLMIKLDGAFTGLITVSSQPLRDAIATLAQP